MNDEGAEHRQKIEVASALAHVARYFGFALDDTCRRVTTVPGGGDDNATLMIMEYRRRIVFVEIDPDPGSHVVSSVASVGVEAISAVVSACDRAMSDATPGGDS